MPQLVLHADNSQISTFLECPMKWHKQYILNIEQRPLDPSRPKSRPLDNGTIVHSLLESYYTLIAKNVSINESLRHTLELFTKNRGSKVSDDDFNLIKMRFREYVMYYSMKGDWTPLVLNGKPQVELGFSIPIVENSQYSFVVEGRIDLITNNKLFVDHKSQERTHNHYPFDTQFLTYSLATGILNGSVNYFGLQKTVTTSTFRRMSMAFSTQHLVNWKKKLIIYFYQMAHCLRTGNFPENENSCKGAWGYPCQYAPIHEALSPEVKELIQLNQYQPREKWSPWSLTEVLKEEENHAPEIR